MKKLLFALALFLAPVSAFAAGCDGQFSAGAICGNAQGTPGPAYDAFATGTIGHVIPFVDGTNTWSASQTFNGTSNVWAGGTFTGTNAMAGSTAVTVPTVAGADNSTNAASTAWVQGQTYATQTYVNNAIAFPINSQSGNYTVLTSDCGQTIVLTGAFTTLTLPAASGFPGGCQIQVMNTSTTRAKKLVGFPSYVFPAGLSGCGAICLWPSQQIQVRNIANVWIPTVIPKRWLAAPTFFVNNVSGSDNNDCLSTTSSACLTIQHAVDLACFAIDAGDTVPIVQIADSGTDYKPFQLVTHCLGTNQIAVTGNPTTPGNVVIDDNSVAGVIVYAKDKGILTLNGMRLVATVAGTTAVSCGQAAVIDMNNVEIGNLSTSGLAVSAIDGCTINVITGVKFVDSTGGGGSAAGTLFAAQRNATITINSNIGVTGTYNISSIGCYASANGTIMNAGTFGAIGGAGAKYLAQLNGVIYGGAANCGGANPGSTATGGQAS